MSLFGISRDEATAMYDTVRGFIDAESIRCQKRGETLRIDHDQDIQVLHDKLNAIADALGVDIRHEPRTPARWIATRRTQ